jgi:hypothetical protein
MKQPWPDLKQTANHNPTLTLKSRIVLPEVFSMAKKRFPICTVTVIFSVLLISGQLWLSPPAQAADIIRVNGLVIQAPTLNQARAQARRLALERALTMLGNQKIPETAKQQAFRSINQLVTIKRTLNTKPLANGGFKPVFFCQVSKSGLLEIINQSHQSTLKSLDRPQVTIGITFRTLPQSLDDSRQAFIDRINNHLEEYFAKAGFRISAPPEEMLKTMQAGKKPNEIFRSFVHNATEVNYLLYGALDINPEDVRQMDHGRYWKSRVGLVLRFFNIPSNDVVSFSRDVYGSGENQKASVINAMRNCAKVISQKVGVNEVIADWQRKLNEGFEYSLQFCSFHGRGWSRTIRRALKKEGRFISRSRGQNLTKIYRFKADPGKFLHPSIDFEDFLDNLEAPGLEQVEFGLMVQNNRLYYVFGDDEQCFDIGFDKVKDIMQGN